VLVRSIASILLLTGCFESSDGSATDAGALRVVARPSGVFITSTDGLDTLTADTKVQLSVSSVDRKGRSVPTTTRTLWTTSEPALATISSSGLLAVRSQEGRVTVTAAVGTQRGARTFAIRLPSGVPSAPPTAAPPPDSVLPREPAPVVPDPALVSWTFCSNVGAVCDYRGLRDVRLIASTGASVTQTAFGSVPCAASGFQNRDPAPGQAQRCEYGPMKTQLLSNPAPGALGMGATVAVARGSAGVGVQQTRSTSWNPTATDGSGSFRTTCQLTGFQFSDPLGAPGRANGSALHVFFGNSGADENATASSIVNRGNSSCRGGTLNRTRYYFPALVDARNGEVQVPSDGVFHYKTGYNMEPASIRPLPAGLVMIAGDPNARGVQQYVAEWLCRDRYVANTGMIPQCAVGDQVQLWISFPQCWDGRNLDSPDHKRHMAYPVYRNAPARSSCPATHPVPLPQVTEILHYDVRPGASLASWRLTTDNYSTSTRGGLSAHARWIDGWDRWTQTTIVTGCLNRAVDCGVGSIGNGTELW